MLLEDMVEKRGRFGRKNGKGFYDYPQGGPKRLWPGLADLLPKKLTRDEIEAIDVEELKQRLLVMQAVEAARTFEDKVVTDVREADVGSILGFGFAPFSGGTLSYIDMMGTKNFVALCRKLEKKYGRAFCAAQAARRHGRQGRAFLHALRAAQAEGGGVGYYRAMLASSLSPRKRGSRAEAEAERGQVRGQVTCRRLCPLTRLALASRALASLPPQRRNE